MGRAVRPRRRGASVHAGGRAFAPSHPARERRFDGSRNRPGADRSRQEAIQHTARGARRDHRVDCRRRALRGCAVVLATGGAGQIFAQTTNPSVATGDGMAMAYAAGAEMCDLEFTQFHPTALALEGAPRFLLSEALRGEGAVLRNQQGEAFARRYDDRGELAPRDIVARAIVAEMERTGARWMYLDLTHLKADFLRERFPNIFETCLRYGLDLTKDQLPVSPAAHYVMGGVR